MKLENLKGFEWYNEPEKVLFLDKEMRIQASPQTDFWQSRQHHFEKDNAHFFFKPCDGDFTCVLKWRVTKADLFDQCGIMVRLDAQNWFKAAYMPDSQPDLKICSSLTNSGSSDLAKGMIKEDVHEIWFKLIRRQDDFVSFYSLNGTDFVFLRQFYLQNIASKTDVGAYICSPKNNRFEAVLDEIEFV